jgi:hypothetical protein
MKTLPMERKKKERKTASKRILMEELKANCQSVQAFFTEIAASDRTRLSLRNTKSRNLTFLPIQSQNAASHRIHPSPEAGPIREEFTSGQPVP